MLMIELFASKILVPVELLIFMATFSLVGVTVELNEAEMETFVVIVAFG